MKQKLMIVMLTAVLCLTAMTQQASAVEVSSDAAYCFAAADFTDGAQLAGIFITALPDASTGTVMLGNRVLRSGDVLTARQIGIGWTVWRP